MVTYNITQMYDNETILTKHEHKRCNNNLGFFCNNHFMRYIYIKFKNTQTRHIVQRRDEYDLDTFIHITQNVVEGVSYIKAAH